MTMENRRKLAILNLCRSFLNVHGFITEVEDERIHNRLLKWQNKNDISISEAQLYFDLTITICFSHIKGLRL